jgi:indolepyruvate ferredoxin oxidoreductase
MTKSSVQLDDKYTQTEGQIYLNTLQAMTRLPMMQRRRDVAAGLNTAGFITGYRGSPVGTYDAALWSAQKLLNEHHIRFMPGVNEELAAAAIKGSQWLDFYPDIKKYDGVFSLWYAKMLGTERGIEAIKAGNYTTGTSKHGGAIIFTGDDIGAKSSITAAAADPMLVGAYVPIFYPATTAEFIEYGLYGWAMSRYSGLWVSLKGVTDTIELTTTIDASAENLQIILPEDGVFPPEGVNSIHNDFMPLVQERRVVEFKMPLAEQFIRINNLNKVVTDSDKRTLGIVTAGKPYQDLREAMRELGIDDALAAEMGLRIYKLAVTWPLEPQGIVEFCRNHQEVMVLEDKSPIIEEQLARTLYPLSSEQRPVITGKKDDQGNTLIPEFGETNVNLMVDILIRRLRALGVSNPQLDAKIAEIESRKSKVAQLPAVKAIRTAYFCSGCPHNTSTKTIDGSLTFTGVGCYGIVPLVMPDRKTEYAAQMGAEGSLWVGLHNFVDMEHSFQNLGDGTYFHSGILAIRSALASGANMTYKILYNDAVAMTGGQPHDGELTVEMLANQVYWEGVKPIAIVTDEPEKYPSSVHWPPNTKVYHRDELETIQRNMQKQKGVSAIIYDQTCAAEKRRRRKRGLFPDPDKRLFINQRVCEGCGDCSVQSNCVSIQPVDTEFGRKRRIDQSSCNKDFSCQYGFCPSFVSVYGGQLRKAEKSHSEQELENIFASLPTPQGPALDKPYNILLTGIGGTGVLTVGAILGMAAHVEEKACSVLDITGMAQKGGAVLSHIRLGPDSNSLNAPRLWNGSADLVIGCDLVVTAGAQVTSLVRPDTASIIVNNDVVPTAQFQRDNSIDFGKDSMLSVLRQLVGDTRVSDVAATTIATRLLGDSIATNVFMLGYALQKGLIPISVDAVEKAIELNGVAIKTNLHTLSWGRMAAHAPETVNKFVEETISHEGYTDMPLSETTDEMIARRVKDLTDYQSADYAGKYKAFLDKVKAADNGISDGNQLTATVARYLYKLMAYKDEYEVARLYSSGEFERRLKEQFEGNYKLKFNLAPPMLSPKNKRTGQPGKREFGPWMFKAFKLLAKFKGLRGTALDIFGYTHERKAERQLIADYMNDIEAMLPKLKEGNYNLLVEIASLPEVIKGYGYIKEENIVEYKKQLEEKKKEWETGPVQIFAQAV